MKALRVYKTPEGIQSRLETGSIPELKDGEVLIRSEYSSINYKDALAVTGKGAILKAFPLIAGIDVGGVVEASKSPKWQVGDLVLVTGCGMGESFDGGFSTHVKVDGELVVKCPSELAVRDAIILGTAGFTAALALLRMEQLGQTPSKGPVVITGASGGVGSLATLLLSSRGYEVVAVSGKTEHHAWLKKLGATSTTTPEGLELGSRPLESGRYGGVIDNVGGELLAKLIAHTHLWGQVASIGLASSAELHTTVMPFILRGVSLLGVSSNNCPWTMREKLWRLLAREWRMENLDQFVQQEVTLEQIVPAAQQMIDRKTHGRILVKISP